MYDTAGQSAAGGGIGFEDRAGPIFKHKSALAGITHTMF